MRHAIRGLVALLAVAAISAGCGDDTDELGELAAVGEALAMCTGAIESGESITTEQREACVEGTFAFTSPCPDGAELLAISVDGQMWAVRDGRPASELPDPYTVDDLDDAC